jgi:hypothetical protein
MARKNADRPRMIGALCTNMDEVPRALARRFAKVAGVALLPLEVEKRHLGNTLACMRLMDIEGMVVCGRLQKDIFRHIDKKDRFAAKAKAIDAIVRRGRGFVGTNLMARICTTGKCASNKAITSRCGYYDAFVELLTHRP